MAKYKDSALSDFNGVDVHVDKQFDDSATLPTLREDHGHCECNSEIGLEPDLYRHNGDEEAQTTKAGDELATAFSKTESTAGPSEEKLANEAEISIEIEDCDLEPNGCEIENPLRLGLKKRDKISDSDTNKTDKTINGGDGTFIDGIQFSNIAENICFLDEDELKEEHEKEKQKVELLMDLVEQEQETVDVSYKNDVGLEKTAASDMTNGTVNHDLEIGMGNSRVEPEISDPLQTESAFSYFPDELIVKIFSYLTTQQLCRSASPVCRKWKQITKEPSLWKSIDFNCNPEIESLSLLWVLRKAPLLRKLVLRGRTNITHAEVAIMSEMCPMLTDLDLGFCDNFSCDMIQSLIENCKCLKKINVEGCNKIDHNCIKCLSKCKKLSHLNFSHCFLQDESLEYLADHLSEIVSINLDGISWITDRGVSSLVSKHYNHLVSVVLDGAEVTDAAIKNIARCKDLQVLEISFCECLTDDSLVFLKDLEKLRELKLRKGSSFTKEGMSEFFRTATLKQLLGLNLSECTCIDDSIVLDIVKCCGNHLTFFSLCWCWFITDTGLVSIVDHCGKLETLELLGIDKITGKCLYRVPEEIPNLTFLDLRQCNKIVDSLIVDMIRRKPDLKVLNYYGEEFIHQ